MCFSGLRLHGSVAPFAFDDKDWHEWLCQINYIAYANAGLLDRTDPVAANMHNAKSVLEIMARMADPVLREDIEVVHKLNHSTFASHGEIYFPLLTKFLQWFAQDQYFLVKANTALLPFFRIHPTIFLSAFYIENPNYVEPDSPNGSEVTMLEPASNDFPSAPSTSTGESDSLTIMPPSPSNVALPSTSTNHSGSSPSDSSKKYIPLNEWLEAPELNDAERKWIMDQLKARDFKARLTMPSQLIYDEKRDPAMYAYLKGCEAAPVLDKPWKCLLLPDPTKKKIVEEDDNNGAPGHGLGTRLNDRKTRSMTAAHR